MKNANVDEIVVFPLFFNTVDENVNISLNVYKNMLRHAKVVIQKTYKNQAFSLFFDMRYSKKLIFRWTCEKNGVCTIS